MLVHNAGEVMDTVTVIEIYRLLTGIFLEQDELKIILEYY